MGEARRVRVGNAASQPGASDQSVKAWESLDVVRPREAGPKRDQHAEEPPALQ